MVTTPKQITQEIRDLIKKLNIEGDPSYIQIKVDNGSKFKDCFKNVNDKIDKEQGTKILGWQIWELPFMIEAEFHAIWKSPNGQLIDITPKPINEELILFIEDTKAGYVGQQVDNVRLNITANGLVDDYIELYKAKFRIENKGERANQLGQIYIRGHDAEILDTIYKFINGVRGMIEAGASRNSLCFCSSNTKYKHCHGKDLYSQLKKII
jgi:hypothetical protein